MPLLINHALPQITVYFWDNKAISADDTSDPVTIRGYRDKILTFVATVGGTLTIESDPAGDGRWDTYDTVTITANTRENYVFPSGMQHAKVRISFSAGATVTASLAMS